MFFPFLADRCKRLAARAKVHAFKAKNHFNRSKHTKFADQRDHVISDVLAVQRLRTVSRLKSVINPMDDRTKHVICAADAPSAPALRPESSISS